MRSGTKSELRMLREMLHFFGRRTKCRFCKKPLLEDASTTFGHRDHRPIKVKLCLHHEDENRENNQDSNLKPAHSKCHKSYHAKKMAAEKRANGKAASEHSQRSQASNGRPRQRV